MASLFVYPSATPVASGNSYASSKLYFYRPGTTTLITVYSTSALDPLAVLTNPVVASATGVFAPIWIDESTNPSYRMIHKTAGGATISDKDNLVSSQQYWARTAAEVTAAVTPTSYRYEPGNVLRYGAVGDGSTDDTDAFTDAALAHNHIVVPDGTYLLSGSISLRAGAFVDMSSSATLKASVRDWASLGVLRCVNVSNVTIRGGNIDGQKASNATGECFGIDLRGADNIRIEGVRIINMPGSTTAGITGGDGIYVGYHSAATDPSTNVVITGCILDGNCRQGISVTGGVGITIVGNQCINATGTGPGGGIDLEADGATDYLRDIQIVGNRIEGNYYGVIITTAARNVTVTGNTIRDNGYIDIDIADCSHVTVMGNTVQSVAKDTPTALIEVRSAQYVNIIGNVISGKQSASDEREAIRVLVGDYVVISNNNISDMRTQAITVGSSGQTSSFTDVIVESNLCVNNVAAGVAATAVIAVSGNSGGGFYPSRVFIRDNHIIDTRTSGDEADEALGVATAIPAATRATYRLEGNTVSGPANTMVGGTYPPLSLGFTWDPGSLSDGVGETSSAQTVTGAALGDAVEVYAPYDLQGITCTGYVSASDAVKVRLQNETGGPIDLASGSWRVRVRKFFE